MKSYILLTFCLAHLVSSSQPTISFTRATGLCDTLRANFTDSSAGLSKYFTDLTTTGSATINSHFWNFGDTLSNARDTSGAQNPIHTYTSSGNFNVCLIVKASFYIDTAHTIYCTDTFCKSVLVVSTGLQAINAPEFTVYPNPSQGFLKIASDRMINSVYLRDVIGRICFEAPYSDMLEIPSSLKNGVYLIELKGGDWDVRKEITLLR